MYCILCFFASYFYHNKINPSILKVSIFLALFLFLIYFFDWYFSQVLNTKADHFLLQGKYIVNPLSLILIISIASFLFISKYSFLLTSIKIYNFEQYFGFVFIVLFSAVMQSRLRLLVKLTIYFLLIYLAYISGNETMQLLISILVVWGIFCIKRIKNAMYYLAMSVVLIVPLIYLIFMYFLYKKEMLNKDNIDERVELIKIFFNNLNGLDYIFPFLVRRDVSDFHNQFIEIFMSLGVIGLFYFYGEIALKLRTISHRYPDIAFSLLIVIVLGGLMVNTTMHPYLTICFAYIIGFYYRLSKIERV